MAPGADRRFQFRRERRTARAGETVLGAVGRGGWPAWVRSLRYHRPRGPVCGIGNCTGCLVRVNGIPNVRACRRPVEDGDRIATENSWPSPRFDLYGWLDRLFPHGIDTVHGFRRPAFATPLYQRFTRRLAGFGAPPSPGSAAVPADPVVRSSDVTIVGAGRSGRALAEALVRRGARPLIVEREPAAPIAGAELLAPVTVTILPAPASREGPGGAGLHQLVGSDAQGRGVLVRSRSVVVATGAYDAGLLFEGSDRPGVVTADLAVRDFGLAFGETVAVGGGDRARQVVERREDDVVAVVAPGEISPELARAAAEREIPLYPRSRVVRALGREHVRGLELARRDGTGRFRLSCRTVVVAHRRLPNAQLVFQAGGARRWVDRPGAYYPVVDEHGRSDVPGVYVVGSASRPADGAGPPPDAVAATITGAPPIASAAPPPRDRPSEIIPYYRELLRERRKGKWVLCACEDVLLEELERAVERGFRGVEQAMRYTGVGTGLCQGRYCLPEATAILSLLEGRPPSELGVVTQRPPLVPTSLGALASLAGEFAPEAPP